MSSWYASVYNGCGHIQACACSKCQPEGHVASNPSEPPKQHVKKLTWKEKMIRMNYKMREEASVTIQKNFRMAIMRRKYEEIVKHKHTPLKDEPRMIVTPVSVNIKSPARRDWLEQVQRRKEGKKHVWDDSKHNLAEVGDLFAYVENSRKVGENKKSSGWIEVYIIEAVHSSDFRLPTWSENVGQGDRNVVELSKEPIYVGTMVEWKNYLGYAERYCVQGTVNLKHDRVKGYLEKIL